MKGIASQTGNFITVVDSAESGIFSVDVSGNVVSATNSYTSDARYKTNVTNMTYGLDTLAKLAPVEFFWGPEAPARRDGRRQLGRPPSVSSRGGIFCERSCAGFIAQEVEAVVPEIVNTDADGYKSLMYDRVAVIAARAIQEQQATIQGQQATIDAQRATIGALEARFAAVEAQVAALLSSSPPVPGGATSR